MLGLKNFRCARALLAGIETMLMIKKGQTDAIKDRDSFAADKLYPLVSHTPAAHGLTHAASTVATKLHRVPSTR